MLRYRVVPRTLLIGLGSAGFLIGLGLAAAGWYIGGFVWVLATTPLLLLCIRRTLLLAVPAVVVVGLVAGLVRGGEMSHNVTSYNHYIGQKVTLRGTVSDDASYNDKHMIDFYAAGVSIDGTALPGKVRVTTFAPISPKRGDAVAVSGKMLSGFGNYQAAMYYADVTVVQTSHNPVDALRHQFAASVLGAVPEPQASLGLGFLLGLKSQLPAQLNDQLQALSLTHIVVASGYNLTILVRVARRLFDKRSKFQAMAASVGLMVGFVAITGFSSSMSRAALVTSLALAAWYYGRRVHPALILLLSAAITAGVNPLFLQDVGWWLSFAAFAGVLLLAPLLQHRIFGERRPKLIGQIVIETVSAQLLTFPIILLVFGNVSLLALPANVLVVPLIPLAMLLTFAGGLVGMVAPAFAGVVAWPATILLSFMTELIKLLAGLPWASAHVDVAPAVIVGIYGAIAAVGVLLWRKTRLNYLGQNVVE